MRIRENLAMYIVAIGWIYVALMMAVAEANSPVGSLLGAVITLALYGVLPVVLVLYIMGAPARQRAIRAQQGTPTGPSSPVSGRTPDTGSQTPANTVAPVRKET